MTRKRKPYTTHTKEFKQEVVRLMEVLYRGMDAS